MKRERETASPTKPVAAARERRSDSRAVLLAAAREEFARHGLRGTRIQSIVARAGVNERMIYHHFESKEGLYQAVVADFRMELARVWIPCLEEAKRLGPLPGWRHAALALYNAFDTVSGAELFVHEWLEGAESIGSVPDHRALPETLRTLYQQGQEQGIFCADRSFEVAYAGVVAMLVGSKLSLPWLFRGFNAAGNGGMDQEVLARQVVDQIVGGLLVHEALA
jgi:TetR/AcrR family transcriptional regulator